MCQLKTCCCRLSLGTGCMISAGYTIIIGVLSIAGCSWWLNALSSSAELVKLELSKQFPDASQETLDDLAKSGVQYAKIMIIISLVLYIFWVLTGIAIFAAVNMRKRGFLLPWMIVTAVLIGLAILGILMYVWNTDFLSVAILGASLFCNMWAFLCVKSFYQNHCLEANEEAKLEGTSLVRVAHEKCGIDNLA